MNIIDYMISKYEIKTEDDFINSLKEIFQEIVLLGLYRGGFFVNAAFYGGTTLRILYGLDRFSEDLDFSLIKSDVNFDIEKYFPLIISEFEAYGVGVNIQRKEKAKADANIESAFLKSNTSIRLFDFDLSKIKSLSDRLQTSKSIKIKLEVDINPPQKFETEIKTILNPTTFTVITMKKPFLFAGKMHAILYRNWKSRVKGRDWYDLEWYVKNNVKLNLSHLEQRIIKSENLGQDFSLNETSFKQMIYERIENVNFEQAKTEVRPFLKNTSSLEFWSKDYFKMLAERIVIS